MMGRNIKMAAVAFTAIITLTGCGTKLYDMTDEEQGLIANYSAYVVAKHNIYQQDGMTNATEKRGDMEDADDTEKVDEASPDNSLSQDNKTSEAGNDKSSNSQKEPSATQEKKVSLAEATGYGSLEITYDGVNESDVYNEGSYYSITAGSGNTFAVMKFTLKNPTDEDINVDMFGNARTYKATFPDGKEYTEKVDEASPDNSLSQDNKTSEAGNDKSSNSQKEPSATQEKKVSLAEATGYGSLEITYDGVNESDVYNEGSYYSITAGSGNTFAVMKFTLKNPTDEDINVDMFGNARTYKATFPDGKEYTAEGTFLTYSLNTFQGTVKAHDAVDVVLLFKIPQGTACDNIKMSVIKDNEKSLIEL